MKKLSMLSTIYLVLGLLMGVFYREFTKINGFEGDTVLATVHTHTLVLGFIFFLVVLLIDKNFNITKFKNFNLWLTSYNVVLVLMLGTVTARGVLEVLGKDFAGLPHIAGTTHALLGITLVWFSIMVNKSINEF